MCFVILHVKVNLDDRSCLYTYQKLFEFVLAAWVIFSMYTTSIPTATNQSICIFSEGDESDFNAFNLTHRFPHTRLYLNGGIREAFHSVMVAPRLVMARSSFSYAAALLNTEQIFYYKVRRMAVEKPLDHWQRLN